MFFLIWFMNDHNLTNLPPQPFFIICVYFISGLICFLEFNYFDGRPHDVHAEHRRRINIQIHDRFRIRDTYDPLNMSITEFTKIYRMPQDAVVTLLNVLRPYVPQRRSPNQTPLLTKVFICLLCFQSSPMLFNTP